jgi:hypothetical protein
MSHDGGKTLRNAGQSYEILWTKKLRRPRVCTYKAADPRPFAIRRNRYNRYGNAVTIGLAVQVGARIVSLVWVQPIATVRTAAARREQE